ncbi:MAG: archease [Thermodesulforhabdaceae bacterium]|jgi:SHS2 domain-containing protein
MPYAYLEDRATADVAFKAWGKTLEELFASCADALLAIMVSKPENICPADEKTINLQAETLDFLLHQFLQEIIYLKDAQQLFLKVKSISIKPIKDDKGLWNLQAILIGEPIEIHKDDLLADVKGITFHDFSLEKKGNHWEATITVDV